MNISWSEWLKYKNRLAAIDTKAADEMVSWLQTKGGYMNVSQEEISEYAYALATKYGEASAALSAQMYDEVAELSGAAVPAAEVASTATYGEVSNAIKYVTKTITTNKNIGNVVGKYTKQAGVDTTLKNAERDGAQFAWVPSGDSCPYCISLAAKGWQYMSKDAMKGGHASHIHANCDCTYATRFDDKTEVEGYDPKVYQEMYNSAEGNTPTEKINSMRRIQYQANKDKINAQKRANYKEKTSKAMRKNSSTSWSNSSKQITNNEFNELKEFAKGKGIVLDDSFKSFDGDVTLVQEFINTMNTNINDRSFMRNKSIKLSVSYSMNDADYAITNSSNVTINGFAYRDKKLLENDYNLKVEEGWFTKNSTYLDIATHETGHVITYMDQLKYSGTMKKVFGKNAVTSADTIMEHISQYAVKNDEELIAEAFVSYQNGSRDEYVLNVLNYCGIVK